MRWLLLLLSVFSISSAPAADYACEKKWADEVLPAVLVGDPVWLRDGPREFLGLYAPAANARAAVIVVHGSGVHPDWGLVSTLRQRLSELGYPTLSVQMPVLAADARGEDYPPTFPEAARRLAQAAAFLKGKGHAKVAIVSHSLGCRMSHAHLDNKRGGDVQAWVAIGTPGTENWSSLALPILDLYGANDLPQVLSNAPTRARALKHPASAQVKVEGADHFFEGRDQALLEQVQGFLDRVM